MATNPRKNPNQLSSTYDMSTCYIPMHNYVDPKDPFPPKPIIQTKKIIKQTNKQNHNFFFQKSKAAKEMWLTRIISKPGFPFCLNCANPSSTTAFWPWNGAPNPKSWSTCLAMRQPGGAAVVLVVGWLVGCLKWENWDGPLFGCLWVSCARLNKN